MKLGKKLGKKTPANITNPEEVHPCKQTSLNSYLATIEGVLLCPEHKHVDESRDERGRYTTLIGRILEPLDEYHEAEIAKHAHEEDHLRDELTEYVQTILEVSEKSVKRKTLHYRETVQIIYLLSIFTSHVAT